jgi:hypothetical protein
MNAAGDWLDVLDVFEANVSRAEAMVANESATAGGMAAVSASSAGGHSASGGSASSVVSRQARQPGRDQRPAQPLDRAPSKSPAVWHAPSNLGPIPAGLIDVARDLLTRQDAAIRALNELATRNRQHQNVAGALLAPPAPAYLDQNG